MFYFVLFARRFHKPNFSPNNQMYSQRLDFEYGKKKIGKIGKNAGDTNNQHSQKKKIQMIQM